MQFYTHSQYLDPQRLLWRLNSLLPHDIRVLALMRTAPDFVVTCSAISKVGGPGEGGGGGGGARFTCSATSKVGRASTFHNRRGGLRMLGESRLPVCSLGPCRRPPPLVCACLQTYHYHIDTGAYHDPLTMRFRAHVRKPLDLVGGQHPGGSAATGGRPAPLASPCTRDA